MLPSPSDRKVANCTRCGRLGPIHGRWGEQQEQELCERCDLIAWAKLLKVTGRLAEWKAALARRKGDTMRKVFILLFGLLIAGGATAQSLPRILCNGVFLGYPTSVNFQGAASCTAVPLLNDITVNLSADLSGRSYITKVAEPTLSGEFALGSLANGLLLNTTATGVPTIYAGTSCSNQFPRSLNASGVATCATVAFATDTSGTVGVTRGGSGLTTVSADQVYVGTAADTLTAKALPNCVNAVTSKLLYDTSTHTFSCGTDQAADPWTYMAVNGGSDYTTSSTTASDVTGLSFTPSANTNYQFECMLAVRTATATVIPRVGIVYSSGLTDGVGFIQEAGLTAATTPQFVSINSGLVTQFTVAGDLPNTTQSWPVKLETTVVAGGAPSGITGVQLASETAGTNVTVKAAGSYCRRRTY
jgi:hypothetical protein